MVKRTRTHIIDTLAVREIISKLPEDWLVRGLEERDYGIDLSLEMFDGENPTGGIALIQVKGKDNAFKKPVKLSFPTKTIEYSLLFQQPFFIFHTSITDKKTYFVWMQKYATTKLKTEKINSKKQGKVTIYFPEENVLENNHNKISEIMLRYSARSDGLEFLASFEWFKEHWESFKDGETALIKSCLNDLQEIKSHKIFFSIYMKNMKINFIEIQNILESLNECVIQKKGNKELINEWVSEIDSQINELNILKKSFLDHSNIDEFCVENSEYPY